jgi:uncharacterized protein YbjT (DUF2867 family)
MILVVGGTGRLGGRIVELLRRTATVRVLTRRSTPERQGIETVRGDLRDAESLARALEGVTTVVCTAHGGDGAGTNGPRYVEGAGIPRLIDLAAMASVRHFLYVSSASARSDSPAEFFRLKAAAEVRLRASGIAYSILRPTHLMETWARVLGEPLVRRSRALVLGSGHSPVPWVAADDIARAAALLVGQNGEGYSLDLGGPEALTITQVNELLANALGVTVKSRNRMSPGMLRLAGRLIRPFNEVTGRQLQLGSLLDTQPQLVDSTPAWRQLRLAPTTFREWLDHNAPALAAQCRVPEGSPL